MHSKWQQYVHRHFMSHVRVTQLEQIRLPPNSEHYPSVMKKKTTVCSIPGCKYRINVRMHYEIVTSLPLLLNARTTLRCEMKINLASLAKHSISSSKELPDGNGGTYTCNLIAIFKRFSQFSGYYS